MVWHKRESKNFYDTLSVPRNPMRPDLIGLEEGFFEVKEGCRRFIVEFIKIVNETKVVGMAEKDTSFFHTTIANVVDLVFCEVYFSSRHVVIL